MLQGWDMGHIFYFPSEGRHAEDFYRTGKIQRLRPGSNPPTRVPEASRLTTRPPKPSFPALNYQSLKRKIQEVRHIRTFLPSGIIRVELAVCTLLHLFSEKNTRSVCWVESWFRIMVYLNAVPIIPFPYLEFCTVIRIVKICYNLSCK
jgi:hypothetical protein